MISVLMPVRDEERYVGEALDSVLGQTWSDLELVVVDDGSTDDTRRIVERAAVRDRRVRPFTGSGRGISEALNVGLRHARGTWIARMDADDVAYPDRLERQIQAAAEAPEVVLWGASADTVDPAGRTIGRLTLGPTTSAAFHRRRSSGRPIQIVHPTALYRRDAVLRVGGYDPAFDGAEDLELWDRLAHLGEVRVLPEPLIAYRVRPVAPAFSRFRATRDVARFVTDRRRRARQGLEPLSFQGFLAEREELSAFAKFRDLIDDVARWQYRRSGVAFAAGRRKRAALRFGLAAGLHPTYAIPRVRHQISGRSEGAIG